MTLKLFNTLSRQKEELKPLDGKTVKIYWCGPTVYNVAHIGNFRSYICADQLRRYLVYKGQAVKVVMNITDVDDKTIKGAQESKTSLKEFTEKYTEEFFKDLKTLKIYKAHEIPRATDNIAEMIDIINALLKKEIAYETEDGIYFSIEKFSEYGKLSGLNLDELEIGKRVKKDEYDKGSAQDFALWKFWDEADGDVFWEDGIKKGRPGWHLECSAMSSKYLGAPFDIHGGGVDLVFPHHENEIAQSKAASGKDVAKIWFHNEHLMVDGKKMSKSLGNFYTLRDLLDKKLDPIAIRYALLSTHYRTQLNFSFDLVDAAKNSIQRLNDFVQKLQEIDQKDSEVKIKEIISTTKKDFDEQMDDDLNIANALSVLFDFVKIINVYMAENKLSKADAMECELFMQKIDEVLGVLSWNEYVPEEITQLAEDRIKARNDKDFKKADDLRDQITEKGYTIEDTKDGYRVKKV